MKIHEYQAREFLVKKGIPVPPAEVASNVREAKAAAEKIGFPVVLKAQVLVGGRGKAGGVKVVKSAAELEGVASQIFSLQIKGYPVKKILVGKAVSIKKEFYLTVTVDNTKGDVVLIASEAGGIDIEETAKKTPEKIQKLYLEGKKSPDKVKLSVFLKAIFKDKALEERAVSTVASLLAIFFENDCSLTEINPLVADEQGKLLALDAKMIFDDNALFRHPEIEVLRDPSYEDADEIEAKSHGLSFVKLDGNIGCVVNGAGLAMATTDVIKMSGGEPANFLDVGGSSNPEKVSHALNIIFRNTRVKAVLINIFGGITRCDDIARGILEVKNKVGIPVPFVVRLTGTNEKEAIEILSKEKIKIYSSMREAVLKIVELAKQ